MMSNQKEMQTVMIDLREMRSDEFAAYSEVFVRDYGKELVANYGYDRAKGIALANTCLEEAFPNGPKHKINILCCIIETTSRNTVGYLWCRLNSSKPAFVSDFYVYPEYRRKGYGAMALARLEERLRKRGIDEIQLRVALDNGDAKRLYEKTGFRPTGTNMSKRI